AEKIHTKTPRKGFRSQFQEDACGVTRRKFNRQEAEGAKEGKGKSSENLRAWHPKHVTPRNMLAQQKRQLSADCADLRR
ncbi:MAG: hypothetical protein V3V20_01270, partial [Algisphaera sp.]